MTSIHLKSNREAYRFFRKNPKLGMKMKKKNNLQILIVLETKSLT